eukprot:5233829-Pyramimonas_sp.AAC.1
MSTAKFSHGGVPSAREKIGHLPLTESIARPSRSILARHSVARLGSSQVSRAAISSRTGDGTKRSPISSFTPFTVSHVTTSRPPILLGGRCHLGTRSSDARWAAVLNVTCTSQASHAWWYDSALLNGQWRVGCEMLSSAVVSMSF